MAEPIQRLAFEQLFSVLPGPHIIVAADDPVFTILYENQAHAELALTKAEKSVGRPLFEVFPDQSEAFRKTGYSELAESFRRVISTGAADPMPLVRYDLIDKTGTPLERWWRVTHYPVFDKQQQNVAAIFQATRDVTDEVQAAKSLEMTRSQLESALAVGLVSTWHWDIRQDVVVGDKNLARNFGVSPQDAARGLPLQRFIDSIHPEDRKRISQAIQATVHDGGVFEEEYRTVRPNGETYWVIGRGTVAKDNHGTPVSFSGVLVDSTGRHNAEAENADLRALNNAKDEFIALASHQLRTPVSIVKQYLGIVMGGYAGEISNEQRSHLQTADEANDRQLHIINDLLKTAQLDAKGFSLSPTRTQLEPFLRELVEQHRSTVSLRNQQLSYQPGAHKPIRAMLDQREMALCLSNLIENASKYSADGKPIIVSSRRLKYKFQIIVKDYGVGIAPRDQKLIFEKFTRVDNDLSDTVAGNGLGLYWVKRIVELHQGTLRIKSTLGKGTSFIIELPYARP